MRDVIGPQGAQREETRNKEASSVRGTSRRAKTPVALRKGTSRAKGIESHVPHQRHN